MCACSKKQNQDDEKAQIVDLIESETRYFMAQDEERWKSCFLNSPNTFTHWTLFYEPGDVVVTNSYEELVATVTDYWSQSESKGVQPFENTNYNIQVRGDVAWARFVQRSAGFGHIVDSYETRILEKRNGNWKIAGVITSTDFKDASPPVPCNY